MKRMFYLLVMASIFSVNAAKTTKATSKTAAMKVEPKKKFTIKSEFDDSKAQEKAKLQGIEKVSKNAIVIIRGKSGSGTGFVAEFRGRKVIITNMHVIQDNRHLEFFTRSGRELKPKSLFFAKDRDISMFELDDTSITPLQIEPKVGELKNSTQVVVYGNSLGESVVTTVKGNLQGTGPTEIETDAKFVNGNSGSPIIDLSTGKVIGVATRATCRYSWTTYKTKFQIRRFGTRIDNISWDDFQKYDRYKYAYDCYLRRKLITSIIIAHQTLSYFERYYGKEPDIHTVGLRKQIKHLHCPLKNDELKSIPEFKSVYRRWNEVYARNQGRLKQSENCEKTRSKHSSRKSYEFSAFNKFKPVETDIHLSMDVRTYYILLKYTIPRLIAAGRKVYQKQPFYYEFFKKDAKKLLRFDAEFKERYKKMLKNLTIVYNAKK